MTCAVDRRDAQRAITSRIIGMLVVNKLAIRDFKYPYTLLLFQIMLTVGVIFVAKGAGAIEVDSLFNMRKLRTWTPVVGIFMTMLVSSLQAMKNGATVRGNA